MKNICLCFQVHHPFHFQTFRFSDIGTSRPYYDEWRIETEIHDAASTCYFTSNHYLLKQIKKYKGKLKLAFYISGTACDQLLMYEPEVINSFRELADTGHVDFLGGTSSHSLITLTSHKKELIHQVKDHQAKIKYLFGVKPQVFVNTDLIYADLIGKDISEAGYRALMTNASSKTLAWRSPNYVYSNPYRPKMKVYFRNQQVSDELSRQLDNLDAQNNQSPATDLTILLSDFQKDEPLLNIYTDYRNLGGAQAKKKLELLESLFLEVTKSSTMDFALPAEIADRYGAVAPINASDPICWVDQFHSNYYPGNELQTEALKQLYSMESTVSRLDDLNAQNDWQYLQTSDHIHLMEDQHPSYLEGSTRKNIYKSKYEAFINYMNILDDFRLKILRQITRKEKKRTIGRAHV